MWWPCMLEIMLYRTRKENDYLCFYLVYWKSPPKLQDPLLRIVGPCGLPKVAQGLIILSKAVPIVGTDRDANFTRLLCALLRTWDPSTMSWDMATICRRNQNVIQLSVLIFKLAVSWLGLDSRDWLCFPSHNPGTQKMWKPDWLTPTTQLFPEHLLL